jgi:hypothetical protein
MERQRRGLIGWSNPRGRGLEQYCTEKKDKFVWSWLLCSDNNGTNYGIDADFVHTVGLSHCCCCFEKVTAASTYFT